MNYKYILPIFLFTLTTFSQVKFEQGYFIDNINNRIECLIKNYGWKNNPTEFEYKVNESSAVEYGNLNNIKEFSIIGKSKFVKCNVKIDKSINNYDKFTYDGIPKYTTELLYLKVLFEANQTLYLYDDGITVSYFIKDGDSEIEQLIYKKYLTGEDNISVNNNYKQQLFNILKESNIPENEILKTEYTEKSIIYLLKKNDNNSNFTSPLNKINEKNKNSLNLYLKTGLNMPKYTINFIPLESKSEFDNSNGYLFGIELEYVSGFNNKKWSCFIDPSYQYFKSKAEYKYINGPTIVRTKTVEIDYKSIEIPIGVRHYFYLNDKSKLFINTSFAFDIPFNSTTKNLNLEIETNIFLSAGFGYNYNDKLSIAAKYIPNKSINKYLNWDNNYKSLSIIFGYCLF